MSELKIGVAEVDITPPTSVPLLAHFEGMILARGTHDKLFCKAMVIDDGENTAAILTNDLVSVDKDFVVSTRSVIEEQTGIDSKNIMITASHTHTAPSTPTKSFSLGEIPIFQASKLMRKVEPYLKVWEETEPYYIRKMASAAVIAFENRGKARIGASKGSLEKGTICTNRRDPNGPMDPDVGVIRVDDLKGDLKAALINYSCHPTVNDPRETLLSGDFPAYAMRVIERVREGSIAMFTNGAEGNISTRWVRREQTFKEAERLGNILGGEALKVLEQIETKHSIKLRVASAVTRLPYKELPSLEEALEATKKANQNLEKLKKSGASHGALRRAITNLQGAEIVLGIVRAGGFKEKEREVEIQVIAFDDTALVGIPGELFVQWGLKIKMKSKFKNTFIIGLANDFITYVLTPEDYRQELYETYVSPWAPRAGFNIEETALRLLNKLK